MSYPDNTVQLGDSVELRSTPCTSQIEKNLYAQTNSLKPIEALVGLEKSRPSGRVGRSW